MSDHTHEPELEQQGKVPPAFPSVCLGVQQKVKWSGELAVSGQPSKLDSESLLGFQIIVKSC